MLRFKREYVVFGTVICLCVMLFNNKVAVRHDDQSSKKELSKPKLSNVQSYKTESDKKELSRVHFAQKFVNTESLTNELTMMKLSLPEQCLDVYRTYKHDQNKPVTLNNCTQFDTIKGIDTLMLQNKDLQSLKVDFENRIKHFNLTEGHSASVQPQTELYFYLANEPWVHLICEIGFNMGHSALMWLGSNPTTTLISFDIGDHDYTRPMAEFFQQKFRDRFNITFGDSTITIPTLINSSAESHHSCDVVVVDGGHTYDIARTDLINMQQLAKKGRHLLVFDDYPSCSFGFMDDLGKSWNELIQAGLLKEIYGCSMPPAYDRGFVLGRYLHKKWKFLQDKDTQI